MGSFQESGEGEGGGEGVARSTLVHIPAYYFLQGRMILVKLSIILRLNPGSFDH